jgi:uncharacterized protein YqeY
MSLTDQINNDIKEAMKAGEKDRLMALRDIKSKLLLEMTKEGRAGEVDESNFISNVWNPSRFIKNKAAKT